MGYFANGTEGEMYRERYCDHCVHDAHGENSCPVWELHLIHNYDQHKDATAKAMLDALIPQQDGIWNGQCRMFIMEPKS